MGDITFGLSRQIALEHHRVPDLLANVRFKTTTGIDSFNLNSSQTALGTGFYAPHRRQGQRPRRLLR